MARNVGVNSTFEQQRLVINELAVDVETLENAGYITGYTEQDNLGTVLARGNQATSDILLTGIITATSFVGDGSNLTGISAGAGGTDNVSTSTLTVAGVSTFNGRIIGAATTNIIPFLYANLSDLPSASDYHGAFVHVHATGKAYYAHSGAWVELVNAGTDGTVGTGTENYNVGVITGTTINATQFVGDGSGLTGVVAQGTGIVIQEEGSSVGTAGTINFIGAGVTATLNGGIASVEITTSGSTYTDSDVDTHLNTGTASNNEVLSWTGSDYDWVAQSAGGISNVLEDTTPQLGGNLDINSKYITGTGGANITGVVTATRFESTSAGTPTIDSPNNLNINAVTVAISTNLTAGGSVTAAQFVGDGSGLTGVVAQGTGIVIQEEGSSVGTAGTINFIGAGVTATLANGIASVEITSSGITTANINADTLNVSGILTANSFVKSSNSGGFLKADGTEDTNTYLTSYTETDPVVGAINGIVKADGGGNISAASAGTDYLSPTGDGSSLTGIVTNIQAGANITVFENPAGNFIVTSTASGGGGDTVTINATATDILSVSSGDISADDPGADRLVFWDDSESKLTYLTAGSGLSISGTEITATGGTETDTLATVTARGNTTTQEITATNFRSNDTTGDGSDIGFAIKYYITSSGASAYLFAGPGVLNSTNNPTLYFHRGFTYILENSTGSGHPFELRVSAGGAAYAPGGNFLTGSINGTQILTVPFDAPGSIVYQCTLHSGMVGTINFVS